MRIREKLNQLYELEFKDKLCLNAKDYLSSYYRCINDSELLLRVLYVFYVKPFKV